MKWNNKRCDGEGKKSLPEKQFCRRLMVCEMNNTSSEREEKEDILWWINHGAWTHGRFEGFTFKNGDEIILGFTFKNENERLGDLNGEWKVRQFMS